MTRYLLEGDTQRSLAKEMGLSKSRISQIYLEALEKIREKVETERFVYEGRCGNLLEKVL